MFSDSKLVLPFIAVVAPNLVDAVSEKTFRTLRVVKLSKRNKLLYEAR